MSTSLVASGSKGEIGLVLGMIVLPKLTLLSAVKLTSIDPNAITGVEETIFEYKGKVYNGTKIYTNHGFFKVFADAVTVLIARKDAAALTNGGNVVVAPLANVPDYTTATALLTA
jgi:hypothetical protein